MEEKILKVKEAVKDLLVSYPDISGVSVFIADDRKEVTIAVDVLAKLRNEEEQQWLI